MRSLVLVVVCLVTACGANDGKVATPSSTVPATCESAQPVPSSSPAQVVADGGGRAPAGGKEHVNGRLDPVIIQKVVRAHFDAFRKCYEEGLGRNPNLSGRVAVKFVIDRSGAVSSAEDSRSDIPDRVVVDCILSRYRELVFPKPDGGILTVVYPIVFNASDDADAGRP
jgi:hypothetical protein